MNGQLGLNDIKNPNCPFSDLLDKGDHHCYDTIQDPGYPVISESLPELSKWIGRAGGLGFSDLFVSPTPQTHLEDYLPTIPASSKKIIGNNYIPVAGVNLQKIYHLYKKRSKKNIQNYLGLPATTNLILFNYAYDSIIEEIWADRKSFYGWISEKNFLLATGINYSIWLDQPHAERLYNLKRGLITFSEMQRYGIPAIPHIYWYGHRDIERLAGWLNNNPQIKSIALNMQTMKIKNDWEPYLDDLAYFTSRLENNVKYIVSGPSTKARITNIKEILKNVTLTNTTCAIRASSSCTMTSKDYDPRPKHKIFFDNIVNMKNILNFMCSP